MRSLYIVLLGVLMTGLAASSALPQQAHHPIRRDKCWVARDIESRAMMTDANRSRFAPTCQRLYFVAGM